MQAWWHAGPATRLHGRAGLAEVIEQFQGFEWPAGDWERLFAERVESYRPEWLDDLCLSGEVAWGRLSVVERGRRRLRRPAPTRIGRVARARRRPGGPRSRSCCAQDLPWLLQAHRGDAVPAEPTAGSGREVLDALRARGAQFHSELQSDHSPPSHRGRGRPVGRRRPGTHHRRRLQRRPLAPARPHPLRPPPAHPIPARARAAGAAAGARASRAAGRCCQPAEPIDDVDELAEAVAWQLLLRWGVVFRDVYAQGAAVRPWREILWALRRLEARGLIRGGHFMTGMTGEQFADEEAAPLLRACRGS